jgi:flagellar assembly factor FliW
MFLSNWLVFKIVLAAVTGLVDYPLAADVLLVYDNANKLYLSGGSLEYVSNVVLYKGETSYEISESLNVDASNEQILLVDDRDTNTQLGYDCAIDGDYIIGGAPQDDEADSQAGAAYIFKRTNGMWKQTAKLIVSDAAANDQAAEFVNIFGDYAIIGVYTKSSNAGAAYIFKRDTGAETWNQQAKLTASDAAASDKFGNGVSINSDYAIVGSPYNDDTATNSGSAYIFIRSGSSWTQQAKLTASDAASNDEFGLSVDISGDYVISGANSGDQRPGSAYIFKRSGTSWSQQAKIQASDGATSDRFGKAVALSGDYAVIGAYTDDSPTDSGSAYIFKKDTGAETWTQKQKLTASDAATSDNFGWKVDISGDIAIIGAYYADIGGVSNAGAAYIFKRDTGTETWTEVKKLTASTHVTTDGRFSDGVGVSGSTIVVGAAYNDVSGVTHAGALYVYNPQQVTNYYITQPGTYRADLQICGIDYKTNEVEVTGSIVPEKSFPSVSTKTYPSDGGTVSDSDYYGYVGLSGNGLVMVVVGKGDDDTTTDSGGFMVYEKINGVWTFTQQITNVGSGSATLGDCDEGKSVQLDYTGTRVFIGAHADDHSTTNSGSVYIYKRVAQGNWTLEQRIDGGGASYRYGYNDVNNDGDKLIIGSYGYPGSGNVGRAWYYTRSGTTWSLQDELVAPTTSAYGTSVGMNSAGTRAIIGGYNHSSNKGRADIWNYSGGSWSIGAGFTGENASDKFGWNVDMSNDGNTVVVGAPQYSSGGGEGRAYIYTTSDGTNWSLLKTLSNQTANEQFGFSVQISGDGNTVVIGAAKNDDGVTDGGRSYVYVKTNGTWPSTPTHTIIGTTANSNNGHTLGISDTGETIISGAPFDDDKGTNQGAVYIFDKKEIASLTFDGYNKLSLTNTPTYTSSKLTYGSNVYDIGTLTSDITIEKQGEYASLTFDTSSNVAYFSNATVGTVLDAPATRAFFYGNFDDTFSDGDVTTAASNGRFYADMPETTTAFGTVSVTSSTSTSTTYQLVVSNELTGTNVLIVGGGGGGGNGQNSVYWPSAGGGGKVQNLTNQTISVGTYSIVVGNGGNGRFESPSSTAGTTSSAFGTSAVGGGAGSVGTSGTSGSGNGPGSNSGTNVGGGGGDASSGGNAGNKGGSGGDGSNVSWLDGSIYGEQVGGQAYFGGGGFGGDSGGPTTGKGNNLPGTGGGGSFGQVGRSGMVAIYSSAGLGIKYLDFDTYNKLSIQNITPTATTLKYGSNTYDLGTISNVYIENPGTYEAAITASDKFALVSNVVGTGQISEPPVYSSATPTLVDPIDITDGIWSSGNYEHYQTHSTYYLYALSLDDDDSDRFIKYDWVNLVWSDQDQSGTYSTFGTSATDTTATARSVTNPTHIYLMAGSQLHATMVNPYYQVPNYSPSLTHDTYNKLSIENITPTASTLRLGSNTYDIGTATDIYIEDTGTYEIETKDANTFALVSNVVDTVTQVGAYDSSATPTLVDPIDITDGIWSSLTYQWYQTHSTYYLYKLSGDPNDSDRFIKYDWVNLVWSDQDQSGTYSTFGTSATDTTATARSITNPTHIYLMAGSQLHATMVNPYYQVPNYSPSLTHDTYNKLSIENITPTASTLRLGSNTYDIGTATDIYIEDTGTYEIETKDSNTFAFASNTATYQVHPNTAYSNYRSIGGISAASTSLHNENITTTYSVTMWAKSASATYIVRTANSDTNASGNNTHGIFGINSSGEFSIPSWTSGDSISVSFSGTPDYRDEWHFYGFEFNDTTIKVHIDGATPITGSTGYSGQTHNRMRFDNPNAFTDGTRLAEFAVYNRALSDAEFVSIYNNGLPNGPDNVSSGRVSWFKCLSGAMGTNSGTGGDFDASFTEDTDVPSAWLDPTPSLTHDTYNKLSIENITPTASTLRLGSNTYDIGTATDIYIEDTGTYEIETKDANTFALVSNVVTGTIKTIEPGFASRYQGSMALTYDGKLYAWGMNDDGEAGVGTSSDITVPTLCTGITQGTVAKLLSSSDITENSRGEVSVIKTTDGKIYMAGKGDNFVIPGTTSDLTSFTDVTSYFGDQSLTANNVTMMSFTQLSGAALTETGNVWTWGTHDSTNKALGQASASSSSTPKQINFSSATGTITKVTCGSVHSLALDTSGDVWFWGKNTINSDSWPSSVTDEPQKVVDGKNIIGLASSYGTMYAWDATGKMWNAGNNWEGQIGDGTTTTNTTGKTLTEVTYFSSNGITINKVYGGGYFVFADTSDGYYCWGSGGTTVFLVTGVREILQADQLNGRTFRT